jgi:hypothetical protein
MNEAIVILDDRPDKTPFLVQTHGDRNMDDVTSRLKAEQSPAQTLVFKPFVLGLTTAEAESLPLRVFAERHGILLMKIRSNLEEASIFLLAQRIDLFHLHALFMARKNAHGELARAADHDVMRTDDYKDTIKKTTGMNWTDFLEARGAVQAVRGLQAHPIQKVWKGLPPSFQLKDFKKIRTSVRHRVNILSCTILEEDDPVLDSAEALERKYQRRSRGDQRRYIPYFEDVRIYWLHYYLCSLIHRRRLLPFMASELTSELIR